MPAGTPKHNRVVGRGQVEIVACRVSLFVQPGLVVAAPLDPLAGRSLGGARGKCIDEGLDRTGAGWASVDLAEQHAFFPEVDMRIVEARHNCVAGELDSPGGWPGQRGDVYV